MLDRSILLQYHFGWSFKLQNLVYICVFMHVADHPEHGLSRRFPELDANASVISGSFVLKWMEPASPWGLQDLDVYTPYDAFIPLVQYLMRVEGYVIDHTRLNDRIDQDLIRRIRFADNAEPESLSEHFYVPRPGDSGISLVLTLLKG